MMKTLMRFWMALAMVSLIAACGGGGGCAGTPTNGTNTCSSASTATPGAAAAVAKFVYTLDKVSIPNTGGATDVALLTMTALMPTTT
jgi:ABC-type glycerol-3-phosphate transport system substrate-binding protein